MLVVLIKQFRTNHHTWIKLLSDLDLQFLSRNFVFFFRKIVYSRLDAIREIFNSYLNSSRKHYNSWWPQIAFLFKNFIKKKLQPTVLLVESALSRKSGSEAKKVDLVAAQVDPLGFFQAFSLHFSTNLRIRAQKRPYRPNSI